MHIERPALVPSLLGILVWGLTGLIVAQDRQAPSSNNSQSALRLRARLGSTRFDVGRYVTSVAWSPEGRFLATVVSPNRVALWDAKTGRRIWQRESVPESQSFHFSTDGNVLIQRGESGTTAFDVDTGRDVDVKSLAADFPDGFVRVGRGKDRTQLLVKQGEKKQNVITLPKVERNNSFTTFELSPNRRYLATGSIRFGLLNLWDVRNGRRIHDFKIPEDGGVRTLNFSRDGKLLAAGGSLPGIYVFDVESGRRRQLLELHRIVDTLAFGPEGKRLVSTEPSENSVKIWNLKTGKLEREFFHRLTRVRSIAFSPDGSQFALAGYSGLRSGGLGIWNVADGEKQLEQPEHAGPVTKLTFSPDSRLLATGSSDETVCLWEVPSGNRLARLEGNAYSDLRFSPDGWMLGAAGRNGGYRIWEVASQDVLVENGRIANLTNGTKSCFSPDLSQLAFGSIHAQLHVIETATGKRQPVTPVFQKHELGSVAFSPDGEWLAVASGRGSFQSPPQDKLLLWNLSQNKAERELADPIVERDQNRSDGFESLHVSPGGRTLAAIHSHQLSLWELSQGRRLHQKPISPERFIAFTPDGKTLLRLSMSDSSPGQQDAARIEWIEAATVGTYRTLEWPERVSAIALSPDRRWLAGALSDSRQVLLWELDSTNTKGPHNREQLDRAVDLLTSNDAKEARQAMASLIASGDRGVGMLAPLLKSIAHPEQTKKDIRRWIEDLDDDDFFVREKATGALNELGRIAVPELKAALENEPSAEAASRLKQLLKLSSKSRAVSDESLRRTRAIEILERIGSAQAFDVLEEVASGRKSSLEVSDARSIDFIEQRAPGQPAANAASTACAVDKSECWC